MNDKHTFGAVVGTGFIGAAHVEALRRLGRMMMGVVGPTPAAGREAAEALNVARSFDTLEEMLDDPMVGVVHVTTPDALHYLHCRQALDAGKHLLCEAPLATSSSEAADLVRIAAGKPVAVGVCCSARYYAMNREAARRIGSGGLGEVYHVTGSCRHDGGPRAAADAAGRWLDLVQFVTGLHVEALCAEVRTFQPVSPPPVGEPTSAGVGDFAGVLLRFGSGAAGCLSVSQVSAGRRNRLAYEVAGSRAALAWDSDRTDELWLGHRDGPCALLPRDPALLDPALGPYAGYPGGHGEGFSDAYKHLFRSFYEYVEAGDFAAEPPFPTFADGHRAARLAEAILASGRESRWVDVAG